MAVPSHLGTRFVWVLFWTGLYRGGGEIAAMSRSTFNQLKLIAQPHTCLDESSLRTLVQALVRSQMNYCNALYVGIPLKLTQRLQARKQWLDWWLV